MKDYFPSVQDVCFNYDRVNAGIKFIKKEKDRIYTLETDKNVICFVIKGKILFSSGLLKNVEIKSGNMFIHPARYIAEMSAKESALLLFISLNTNLNFCDYYAVEKLCDEKAEKIRSDFYTLKFNKAIRNFIRSLEFYPDDELHCTYFGELKQKELMFILRAFYPKESLRIFFHPILNKDREFAEKVIENIKKVKTVRELAEMSNYSLSGFEKRFKKVFGMPVIKWMEQEKARQIYHAINCSNKTMMEIGYDFGFSPSHFNNYCKRIFKKTPSKLREVEK